MNKYIEHNTSIQFNDIDLNEALEIINESDTPEAHFYNGYVDQAYGKTDLYESSNSDYRKGYDAAAKIDKELAIKNFFIKNGDKLKRMIKRAKH